MNGEGRGRRLDWGRSEGGGRREGVGGGREGLSPYLSSCLKRGGAGGGGGARVSYVF